MRTTPGALAVLMLFGAVAQVRAECGPSDTGAPRVGLVLSGGGARGLAHVGVLAVLEEEGIPVGCVSGTSMGAAIGALWASGYTAAEIAEIVQSIDWQEVFSGRRVRALVPLSRRVDDISPAIRLRFDGPRARLPPARDSDYRLNRLLFKLLAERGLRSGGDFDRLPVPFRTVAADLATVRPVVLDRGSLARAVRASMSPPVTLPTIEVDGRVLVDGGIVDNVPVDLARGMGADVVIAVDVTSPPPSPDTWGDILGAGRQLIDALMRDHARQWQQDADVVVKPALEGIGAEDFSDPAALIEAGRAAARAALPSLRALAPAGRPRPASPLPPPPLVSEIVVRGNRRVSERSLQRAFGVTYPEPLDVEGVLRGFDRVWATGLFDALWVDVEPVKGGVRLALEVRESPPAAFEVGWAYDEADEVNAFIRGRHRNLFGHGERLDLTLLGGARDSGARLVLLGDGLWRGAFGYLAGGQLLEERPVVYRGGEEAGRASFSRDVAFIGAQASFGPDFLVQGRADAGRVISDERRGLVPAGEDPYRMLKGLVAWDRLDDTDLPESGVALTVRGERSLSALDGVRDYWRLRADGRAAWSPAGALIVEGAAVAGFSGRDVPDYDLHRIGGPRFLPGHPREELWARQVFGVAVSVGREVRGFRLALEGGGGGAWDRRAQVSLSGLRWGAGLGIARRTRLGPVMLQAGIDEDGRGAVYLSTGRR
jgi:NTE family protein